MSGPRRILGTETEFGIIAPDEPMLSPIETSTQAVIAYAAVSGAGVNRRTRWDYAAESPLRDMRGFDLRRYRTAPVIDPNTPGNANVVTTSGARFYVDHAHPEFSSPETTDAWDAVIQDKAGELMMHEAAQASSRTEGRPRLQIHKNNVDGKGASYGAHENYLYPREYDAEAVQAALIPHFVTRQIYCGAGRVGLGESGQTPGFQISQRADYIETTVSLETTLNRGIINTRDEPHAGGDWARMHVIIGDANLSEFATFLKLGTTALVLDAVGAGVDFSDLALYEPVNAVREVSRDLDCTRGLRLYGNREMTAVAIQREIRRRVAEAVPESDRVGHDDLVLQLWGEILDDLERDPASTADRLDWTAKYALLTAYRARGLEWGDPRLAMIDIQYHDIDPAKGLYNALVRTGRMRTLVPAEEVRAAVTTAPRTTRAWLRGEVTRRFPDSLLAANWDSLILDVPFAGSPATRVWLPDPSQGTADQLEDALADVTDPADLVGVLERVMPECVTGLD
ncbi:depupylase/deamidase Dop [Corynebacterium terpenotabidum]|uniref:Proteasome accessory factor n=1 Tax=Corynebacterium terpenotabidum Y-11 TaxID=1200352 RepID=S4XJK0_9CORY|nr:depupylase/deamidase Dop [Corynebacterium terpenotabidum]AGP30753.1 proteasome accessory factor [Corynebacterium terpenotabidum Y-11]